MQLSRRQLLAIAGMGLLCGCSGSVGNASATGWGKQGRRFGEFLRPRAIGVHNGEVYVIDTTGRMQVFDEQGVFIRSWTIPETENGTPTDIVFHEDGRVLVPDTHNSRVLEFTMDGALLTQWGSFGTATDQFIYPTGLSLGASGEFFLSEYGTGAERVHVFDSERRFLRQWGSHGEATGEFNRAMAIGCNQRGEVLVADTANHRVQVFDADGSWLRTIGEPGTAPGQLKYPHDMAIGPDDTIYLAEYGAHRISRFHSDGAFIETFGSAGRGPEQLNAPRGVAVSPENRIYVADTDNHRIQIFEAKAVTL
jgi:DNA-binding beta-propeller fold protein YncE